MLRACRVSCLQRGARNRRLCWLIQRRTSPQQRVNQEQVREQQQGCKRRKIADQQAVKSMPMQGTIRRQPRGAGAHHAAPPSQRAARQRVPRGTQPGIRLLTRGHLPASEPLNRRQEVGVNSAICRKLRVKGRGQQVALLDEHRKALSRSKHGYQSA